MASSPYLLKALYPHVETFLFKVALFARLQLLLRAAWIGITEEKRDRMAADQ